MAFWRAPAGIYVVCRIPRGHSRIPVKSPPATTGSTFGPPDATMGSHVNLQRTMCSLGIVLAKNTVKRLTSGFKHMIPSAVDLSDSLQLLILLSNSMSGPFENGHLYSVSEAKIVSWCREISPFLQNTMFLKTCIFWKPFKNVRQVVKIRRWNHYKTSYFSSHAVSLRLHSRFRSRKRTLSEKWHSHNVETESGQSHSIGWSELFKRWWELFKNLAKTIVKRDVFGKGSGAWGFFSF